MKPESTASVAPELVTTGIVELDDILGGGLYLQPCLSAARLARCRKDDARVAITHL